MRRRPPEVVNGAPARLVRYDPADWANPACHPECAFWAAVQEWDDEHPDAVDDVLVDGPDQPWHPELI